MQTSVMWGKRLMVQVVRVQKPENRMLLQRERQERGE
jgi:hypothetical protein